MIVEDVKIHEHEAQIEGLIKHWFKFRDDHKTTYNYYIDSMFEEGAIELSYFKLATFLEGFHREQWEIKGNSDMRKIKQNHFQVISRLLEETEVEETDRTVIRSILNNNIQLTFRQRLKDIFEYYGDTIAVVNPILSFIDKNKLLKLIKKADYEKNTEDNLIIIIECKRDADLEKITETRNEKYEQIMKFLRQHRNLVHHLLSFVKFVVVEKLSRDFANYRNIIAHLNDKEYQNITTNNWYYAYKILQLVAQIVMLSLLGLGSDYLRRLYFLPEMDEISQADVRNMFEYRNLNLSLQIVNMFTPLHPIIYTVNMIDIL